jgi:hypothetical protein
LKTNKAKVKAQILEEANFVKLSPNEKKIFDLVERDAEVADSVLKKNPYVVLKYFQEAWECFSEWEKDELQQFSGFLKHLGNHNWQQVYTTGSKIPKHGLAYTKYEISGASDGAKEHLKRVRQSISEEISFFELRVNQNTLRVHGFQSQSAFFLVLLDRSHAVLPM